PGWRLAYLDGGGAVLLADGGGAEVPEGATGPVEAFATPGIAAVVETIVAPIRRQTARSSTYYQRGRALHYLFGPPAFPLARAAFEAALRAVPDDPSAIRGLQATTASR